MSRAATKSREGKVEGDEGETETLDSVRIAW